MILLSLGLLGFAVADLIRGPLDQKAGEGAELRVFSRMWLGVAGGTAAVVALAVLAGSSFGEVVVIALAAAAALGVWVSFDHTRLAMKSSLAPLAWMGGVLVAMFAISSLGDPIDGPLEAWYSGLAFSFVTEIGVEQFVLGCCAALFAVASCNRIVVLVLGLAATSLEEGESRLKGGRFLGPMERIIVGAAILGGNPAAAAIVIAAKGLLRFPEIHQGFGSRADEEAKSERLDPDANTEYFLIGTLSSLLLAGALAICVSGSG